MEETNSLASGFVLDSLRTGKVDRSSVAELKGRYEAIRAEAADLEPQLRDVEKRTVNPAARRVLRLTLQSLASVRLSAARAVELLDLLDD